MEIKLNMQSGVPIYIQVVDQIKYLVATGRLEPGDQLPTVRQLATDVSVNPNTIARAYTELEREGIIVTQQGRGTYVKERPADTQPARVRLEKLRQLFSKSFVEARISGYSIEEVRGVVEEELKRWPA